MSNPQSTISPAQNTTALIADLAQAHGVLQNCLRQEAAQNFRTLGARKRIAEIEEEIAWAMREEQAQRDFDAALAEQCEAALDAGHNPGRVQQAAQLVQAGAVQQDKRAPYVGYWWVASQSDSARWPYHLAPCDPVRTCSCADAMFNRPHEGKCKHALAALFVIALAQRGIENRRNGHK